MRETAPALAFLRQGVDRGEVLGLVEERGNFVLKYEVFCHLRHLGDILL